MSCSGVGDANETSATALTVDQVTTSEIVVGLGGSPVGAGALCRAAEQSRVTGVPLRIVHAWQMTASPSGDDSPFLWVASAADARARATRWVMDTLGGSSASVRWILEMVEIPAAPAFSSQPGGNA